MNFLKGLAISFLSFLLFLSLTVFGLALTLNNTVLSADFVTSQLDELDISSLVEEAISQQSPEEELPEELKTALIDAITKLEPVVKEQVTAAIYPIYDYLLGKSPSLDLADTLYDTILIPDLIVSLLDELDIPALAEEVISQQAGEGVSQEEDYLLWAFLEASDDIIAELEPWIKDQVSAAVYPIYDYLLGESQSLSLVIPLEPVKESIRDALWQVILESPPPELAGLPVAELEQEFNTDWDEFWNELWGNITQESPQFEFTGSSLSLETPAEVAEIKAEITEALAEGEEALEQAREYVGYFQTGYGILIGFMILVILGIVLINREVRSTTRILGLTFLTYGVLELVGIFIAKNLAKTQIVLSDMPSSIQVWLPQLFDSALAPLQTLCIVLIVAGVALLVVSFIYKPRQPSS